MVSTSSFNFSSLYPDIQQKQMLADALSRQGQEPINPNRMAGNYAVPVSPWEGLAKLAQTAVGAYGRKKANEELAEKLFGSSQQGQAKPWVNPDTGQVAPGQQIPAQGNGGLASTLAVPGMSPQETQLAMMVAPEELIKANINRYTPTESTKNNQQLGINTEIARALELSKRTKEGSINLEPGNTFLMADGKGSYNPMVAPQFDKGLAGGFGANGQPYVAPIPGAANAAAQMAGAVKGAEQANTIFTGQTVNGRENVPVPGGQIFNQPQAGARPPQWNGPNDPGEGVTTNVMPNAAPVFGATKTDTVVKPQTQSAANEDFIKFSYRPVLDAGATAKRNLSVLQTLDNLDISGKTGWGTETKAKAANVLVGLGIPSKDAEEYAGDAQVFNSALQQQTWNLLGQQKGMQTEGDAQRARDTFAQLGNTPAANEFIKDLAKATNNNQVRQAQFYQQKFPEAQSNGDLTRIESEWSQKAPSIWSDPVLSKWQKNSPQQGMQQPVAQKPAGGMQPPLDAIQHLQQHPGMAAKFEQKYGVPAAQFLGR